MWACTSNTKGGRPADSEALSFSSVICALIPIYVVASSFCRGSRGSRGSRDSRESRGKSKNRGSKESKIVRLVARSRFIRVHRVISSVKVDRVVIAVRDIVFLGLLRKLSLLEKRDLIGFIE